MLSFLSKWTTISERIDREELLDLNEGSLEQVEQSLRDLTRINRWLGGTLFLRKFLFPRIQECGAERPIRILDAGSGSASTAVAIVKWARRNGKPVQIIALDTNERHLQIARGETSAYPEIHLVRADALQVPFPAGAFDFVISSLFLHHFGGEVLAEMIANFVAACRGQILLNDLIRDWVPYVFFCATMPLFARSPLTRHDGKVSLRRAYTTDEMRKILARAGFPGAQVHTDWLYYRMTIVIQKEPG